MSNQFSQGNNPITINIPPRNLAFFIGIGILIFVLVIAGSQSTFVVEPGHRGVRVTLGKVSPLVEGEGLKFKAPFVTTIYPISVRQQTEEMKAECYSADLQQVTASLRILYRVPEGSVVTLFRDYEGDAFTSLVAPRVQEALKEAAALQSAELIVQNRETIKLHTLEAARKKISQIDGLGPLVTIEDIALSDIALSRELNAAIEQKMTQKEEAERAKFVQQQAEIDAKTAVIKARGEAKSIQLRGEALRQNPSLIKLQIVEKWDGISPFMVGGQGDSANVLLPLADTPRLPTKQKN
jgi:prohibitin 2